MKKPHVLNRPMFNRGGISAYGRGITSNLVSDEQRQRFNDGGRVRAAQGYPDMRRLYYDPAALPGYSSVDRTELSYQPLVSRGYISDVGKPVEGMSMAELIDYGIGEKGDVYGHTASEIYSPVSKTWSTSKKPKATVWKDLDDEEKRKIRAQQMESAQDVRPVVDEQDYEKGEHWRDLASEMLDVEDVKKELDPKAGLTGEPEEGRIEKMLAENVAKSKQRAKIAALTRGVSMASNLLDKPTFAKAAAAAGKEAPLLAKETAAAMKGAETLPLQWEMIKEKIALTGEEAVKKAEVGEKRKEQYQTRYLDILEERLDLAKADPKKTMGDLFGGSALKLSGYDQAKLLKELASQKGLVLKIKAIDASKPKNYENLDVGTIVKDTVEGDWYFIEQKGVLGVPVSQKDITDGIDLQVQKTLVPGR